MSFFVKGVKTKAQKLNLKRKSTQETQKIDKNNLKKAKFDPNEEIPSDTDDELNDDLNERDLSDFDDNESDNETAQEKKLRLAKQYLKEMSEQNEQEDISTHLRDELLEKTGKLKKLVAQNYTNASVVKEFKGHKLSTTCVVVSNDSKYVFSGSKDGSIIKWDVETGKKIFIIKKKLDKKDKTKHGHSDQVFCLALSNDFKYLASGSADTHIIIWDPVTCTHIYSFYGHRDAVTGLSFRQNTHQLYSSSYDRCVKLWSVDEMSYVETLYGHQDKILSVDSLNKERCITCGSRDRTIRIWKIVEESQLVFQGTHFNSIDCVALINDDNWLSGSDDGMLALWHISKKKPLYTVNKAHYTVSDTQPTWICSVAALHNTDLIASGSNDGYIRVWACSQDFFKFEEKFKVKVNGFVNDLKFSNDGDYLIAAIGQEHKLGRWSNIKECRNSVVIIKFDKIINEKHKIK